MAGALDDPATVLAAWEAGNGEPPLARGAAVLWAAGLVPDRATALDLPVGEAAALEVAAFTSAYGQVADCAAECPGCAESLDLTVDLRAIPSVDASTTTVDVAGRSFTVKAPTIREVLVAAGVTDPGSSLLAACLREFGSDSSHDGSAIDAGTLDPDTATVVDAVIERLSGAAATVLVTTCPGCGADVRAGLDPGELLWAAVSAAAHRLLGQVAALAAAFGWTERDVLGLPPRRRAAYLAIAGR